jgi:hypothetical protein
MTDVRKPRARSEGLVIEQLDDELLVYDRTNDRAHCLSGPAARVWQRCDGRSTIEGLGAALELDAATVDRAAQELRLCGLLEGDAAGGLTRREMTLNVAKVGAATAAAPLIISVVAPSPAEASTPTVEQCRAGFTSGCGSCTLSGCCCCGPGGGNTKDCVPTATCGVVNYPAAPTGSICSKTNA